MKNKLHIDLSQGVLDVEGDPDLVKFVYMDFKDLLVDRSSSLRKQTIPVGTADTDSVKQNPKTKSSSPRAASTKKAPSPSGIDANSPKRDKELNTAELPQLYSQFLPSNAAEKILIFLKFLIEDLGIDEPNTDQVYTCFLDVSEKLPEKFAQAFRDTSGKRKGYINYGGPEDISISTKGNNHFQFSLKRAGDE